MRYLHDVNLLLALVHEDHPDHHRAFAWLHGKPVEAWATCELTQSALVRLSMNPHVVSSPADPVETRNNLEIAMQRSDHQTLSLPASGHDVLRECLAKCQGYKQITNAHLIAIAISNGATLATCDARLRQLSPDPRAVEVIPFL